MTNDKKILVSAPHDKKHNCAYSLKIGTSMAKLWPLLSHYKFLWNAFCTKFYKARDFGMHHYVRFLQIRSHLVTYMCSLSTFHIFQLQIATFSHTQMCCFHFSFFILVESLGNGSCYIIQSIVSSHVPFPSWSNYQAHQTLI